MAINRRQGVGIDRMAEKKSVYLLTGVRLPGTPAVPMRVVLHFWVIAVCRI